VLLWLKVIGVSTLSQWHNETYPCDNIIEVYFGKQDFSKTGEAAFKKQMYQCLMGQALEMKGDIETRRSTNEWGTVIWQINEIWPTGGWGSIEYGTPVKGQVLGGRWKPLHHWLNEFLYESLFATCSSDANPQCVVKNDSPMPFDGTLTVSTLRFSDGMETMISHTPLTLAAGAGTSTWVCALSQQDKCQPWSKILSAGGCGSSSDCMLITSIKASTGHIIPNYIPLTTPQMMNLTNPTLTWSVDQENGSVTLKANTVVVYVVLTTEAQGRFSENAFVVSAGSKIVQFVWYGKVDVPLLKSTLRVEHVKMYQ